MAPDTAPTPPTGDPLSSKDASKNDNDSTPHITKPETEQAATETTTTTATTTSTPILNIGDSCLVRWRNGERQLEAVIVERRMKRRKRSAAVGAETTSHAKKQKKEEDASATMSTTATATTAATTNDCEMEYYVHYKGHDRRLDEWITVDKFLIETLERKHPDTSDAMASASMNMASSSSMMLDQLQVEPTSSILTVETTDTVGTTNTVSFSRDNPNEASDIRSEAGESTASGGNVMAFSSGGNWHGSSGDPSLAAFEKEHEEITKLKNISKIWMGAWQVEAWYYSPFPDEYSGLDTLYVCEFCLTYMRKAKTYRKHLKTCPCRHPPGRQIYKEPDLAVYELDGQEHTAYCQKLCLLAKLFLDHKTLYYNVNPFFFYVVCKVDATTGAAHMVGYFSKEKLSSEGYNLACILTLPQYQKAGYGKFIISLSYELTKRQGQTGSPEKPLSDLGKLSYRSYWKHVLFHLLAEHDTTQGSCKDISILEMSAMTGIKHEDILSTLQALNMIKVWKGQHVVYVEQAVLQEYMSQMKNFRLCKPEFLDWKAPPPAAQEQQT